MPKWLVTACGGCGRPKRYLRLYCDVSSRNRTWMNRLIQKHLCMNTNPISFRPLFDHVKQCPKQRIKFSDIDELSRVLSERERGVRSWLFLLKTQLAQTWRGCKRDNMMHMSKTLTPYRSDSRVQSWALKPNSPSNHKQTEGIKACKRFIVHHTISRFNLPWINASAKNFSLYVFAWQFSQIYSRVSFVLRILFRSLRACAVARHPGRRVLCFKWLFLASTGRTTSAFDDPSKKRQNDTTSGKWRAFFSNVRFPSELQTIDSNPKVSAFMVWDPAPTMLQHGATWLYMCKEPTVWMGSLQLHWHVAVSQLSSTKPAALELTRHYGTPSCNFPEIIALCISVLFMLPLGIPIRLSGTLRCAPWPERTKIIL